jgi:carbamoyltransferase
MKRAILVGHANGVHDPAICVEVDGQLYAEAIERHTQCKRGFEATRLWYSREPLRDALRRMDASQLEGADVTVVSTWDIASLRGWDASPSSSYWTRLQGDLARTEDIFAGQVRALLEGVPPLARRGDLLQSRHGTNYWSRVIPHHIAHAANAVYTSPFEECVAMVIDGYGERSSLDFYHFHDDRFDPLGGDDLITSEGVDVKQSLGSLYTHVTWLCGFKPHDGEEWKVMGLAAYGAPRADIHDFFRERIHVRGLAATVTIPDPDWERLESLVGGFRRETDPDIERSADLAHNFQRCFEDVILELARSAHRLGLSDNLAYAGGCALNSSVNGKLIPASGFTRLHVPSAPADDGNALGAVLHEKHCVRREPRSLRVMSPYLGSPVDAAALRRIVSRSGAKAEFFDDEASLCDRVADLLAGGEIIGWMQGRAEYGPRALGMRSILADPRPADMKDRINARVKFREEYRPLAPSILHEHGPDYFENYQESPYMERTLVFREEVRARVPAVVHRDGTGRLHSVREDRSPRFYRLIERFRQKTQIPLLLNTSYNVMGKPIVHSIEDALTVLYTTGLDRAVIENCIISR